MKKNVIVGQSGGPTAVINASLYGVVSEALKQSDSFDKVYGMVNGIEGFLNGNIMDMKPLEESGELELVKTTPGSYLGSCRYKLPEDLSDEVYPALFRKFEEYGIGCFFYIGGNDSMDTVSKLPAMQKAFRAISALSAFRKPSTTTWSSPTTLRDSEARQNMWLPQFGKSLWTLLYTTIRNPLLLWKSWDAMQDGLLRPVFWPANSKGTTRC